MTITEEPPTTEAPAPSSPSRRRRVLAIGAIALLAAAAGAWLVLRDDTARSTLPKVAPGSVGTVPTPASAPPDAGGTELLGLLEKGRKLTFHATYKASGDTATTGEDLSVEVWRKDGNIRQDSHVTTGSGPSDTAGFVVGGKAVTCSKLGNDPWACSNAPDPGTNLDGIFGSAATQLAGAQVTARDDTVAGRAARCFDFVQADGKGTICITPDGLPLQLKINDVDLTLDQAATSVDDSVFEPPAAPTDSSP